MQYLFLLVFSGTLIFFIQYDILLSHSGLPHIITPVDIANRGTIRLLHLPFELGVDRLPVELMERLKEVFSLCINTECIVQAYHLKFQYITSNVNCCNYINQCVDLMSHLNDELFRKFTRNIINIYNAYPTSILNFELANLVKMLHELRFPGEYVPIINDFVEIVPLSPPENPLNANIVLVDNPEIADVLRDQQINQVQDTQPINQNRRGINFYTGAVLMGAVYIIGSALMGTSQ